MKQLTEEQKQKSKERKEKFRSIWQTVAKMSDEERNKMSLSLGIVTCEGRVLSANNQCFLAAQSGLFKKNMPSVVGGFRQWLKQGRNVKKGEKGMAIWIPAKKKEQAEIIIEETCEGKREKYFLLATVFDITQTEERK